MVSFPFRRNQLALAIALALAEMRAGAARG